MSGAWRTEVQRLLAEGRKAEALAFLQQSADAGDASAIFHIATLRSAARYFPYDAVQIRLDMRKAAAAGHREAAFAYINMVGVGVGGPQDWPGALKMLSRLAGDNYADGVLSLLSHMGLDEQGNPTVPPETISVSEKPWVRRVPGFASAAECRHLVKIGLPRMAQAEIIDTDSGELTYSDLRTANGANLYGPYEDMIVHAINRRIAAATATEVTQGEPVQILRYEPGQEFKPHMDYIPGVENQRFLTCLLYLSTDYTGGETWFTATDLKFKGGLGSALIFRNTREDGRADPAALHAGTPVLTGTKMVATRWIRQRPYVSETDAGGKRVNRAPAPQG